MAIYHFHVDQISRSAGRSVVASAAYRAGEKLQDDYYGMVVDYTRKRGVIATKIMAPDYMPEEFYDRATLWNAIEAVEKHPKAQLAYSFDIALMNEFSREENWEIAQRFVQENFVKRGMICDVAFHEPEKDGMRNPHIHVLCPIRPMNRDGTWGAKQRREYLTDERGDPLLDEKGKPIFNAVWTTDWGRPDTLEEWRTNWATVINEAFGNKNMDLAIDHRSYKEQGINLIPQIHEGPHVREMEKKGIRTEKGDLNRFIREINKGIKALRNKLKSIIELIAELSKEMKALPPEPKELTLAECLTKYFEERNRAADEYAYGSRKAKCSNAKKEAKVLLVLQEKNITTLEELKTYASKKQDELNAMARGSNTRSNRIREIKELLRYDAWYKEGQPVEEQIQKQYFKKQKAKLQSDNQEVLNRYYVAKRILKERKLLGKIDPVALKREMETLETERKSGYEQYKEFSGEVKDLMDIVMYSQKMMEHQKEKKREEVCR